MVRFIDILVDGASVWNPWREKHPNESRYYLGELNLRGKNLSECNLQRMFFPWSDFSDGSLKNTVFDASDLHGSTFHRANLDKASFAALPRWNNPEYWDSTGLDGTDFEGASMVEVNLTRASLSSARLNNANMSKSHLISVDAFRSNLTSTNLSKANLCNSVFSYANLQYADLSEANLNGIDLTGANLSGANLGKATLLGVNFTGACLDDAVLHGAIYNDQTLWPFGADAIAKHHMNRTEEIWEMHVPLILPDPEHLALLLKGKEDWNAWRKDNRGESLNLAGLKMDYSNFNGYDFSYTSLYRAHLRSCDLRNGEWRLIGLVEADLSNSDFENTKFLGEQTGEDEYDESSMTGALFINANLKRTKFSGADCDLANFHKANLSYADLAHSQLRKADFSYADLSWANLSHADLSGANLQGAKLLGTNLEGAVLKGTVMPDGSTHKD